MVEILERFGFDVILIETVGAGQGDVAVRELADRTVLLLQPESGDDLQWEKAGILEVADIVVIHKADLPGAELTEAQIKSMLELGSHGEHSRACESAPKDARQRAPTVGGIAKGYSARGPEPVRWQAGLIRLAHQQLDSWLLSAQATSDPGWTELMHEFRAGRVSADQQQVQVLALASGDRSGIRQNSEFPRLNHPCAIRLLESTHARSAR